MTQIQCVEGCPKNIMKEIMIEIMKLWVCGILTNYLNLCAAGFHLGISINFSNFKSSLVATFSL